MFLRKAAIIFFSIILLAKCDKGSIDDVREPEIENVAKEKKGVAYTNRSERWSHRTSELGAHWMYSWGNRLQPEVPENVEFVPMFWGKNSVKDENIERIKALVQDEKVKFVLGFNEPDGEKQANMTVDIAIELWPELEKIGVPLVSPAAVNPLNDWMKEFMQKAEDKGLRIDYVAVHHYGGTNVEAFINKLKSTYQTYGKPIWITEFAVADWNADVPENNRHSEEAVQNFMKEVVEELDNLDWVYRYAWFDGRNAPLFTSALYKDRNTALTGLGKIYAKHQPNTQIGEGKDTEYIPPVDKDEILINGGFESGKIEPWGGFKNGVAPKSITDPNTGNFCGRIQNGDGSLTYVVDVNPGVKYNFRFFSKWSEVPGKSFSPVVRNNLNNDLLYKLEEVALSKEWTEMVTEFTVPPDGSQIKVVFYKENGFPPFFIDDVSLKVVN